MNEGHELHLFMAHYLLKNGVIIVVTSQLLQVFIRLDKDLISHLRLQVNS